MWKKEEEKKRSIRRKFSILSRQGLFDRNAPRSFSFPGTGGPWLTSTVPPALGDINAATISRREMEFHAANPFPRHTRLIYSRGPRLSVSPSAIAFGRFTRSTEITRVSGSTQISQISRVDRVTRRSKSPFCDHRS